MSGNLLTYSGIITKVKSMESRLITLEDYQKIANLDSVAEFISFLKNQPAYAELFSSLDEQTLHRGQIEQILINSLYLDYAKIYRFASHDQRGILNFIFFRFEVNILKTCLQKVYNKKTTYDLSVFESFFNQHSDLNVAALAAASTLDEFIAHLKDTPYYPLFIKLHNAGHETLFDYEIQLDIYYFKRLWKLKDKYLNGSDLTAFTHIYGCQIDLLNIMWVYRSKKFFDIDSGKIYANLIPINYKLSKSQVNKMVEAPTIEEFLNTLKPTYYHRMYEALGSNISFETLSKKLLNKFYHDNKLKYPATMAPVNAFLFFKGQEIDHLTTVLECIRYKLNPDKILQYIL